MIAGKISPKKRAPDSKNLPMNRHACIPTFDDRPGTRCSSLKDTAGPGLPERNGRSSLPDSIPLHLPAQDPGGGSNPARSCFRREEGSVPAEPGTRTSF